MDRSNDRSLTTYDMMGLTELGETSTAEKVAIGAMIAGAITLLGGAAYYFYATRRRTTAFGQVVQRVQAGGMTLEHHKDEKMPIEKRIKILQDLTWTSVQDPRNRKLALEVTRSCPERDGECEARVIYRAMKGEESWGTLGKRAIRYTGDVAPVKMGANGPVEGVDLYQAAHRTYEFGGGDCDDHAILAATMLTLNGIQAKFRVTAPKRGGDFSHIYTLAGLPKTNPKKWVALDTTLPGSNRYGVEVPFGRNADFPA